MEAPDKEQRKCDYAEDDIIPLAHELRGNDRDKIEFLVMILEDKLALDAGDLRNAYIRCWPQAVQQAMSFIHG